MNRFDMTMKKIEMAHKARWPTTGWQPLNTAGVTTLARHNQNA